MGGQEGSKKGLSDIVEKGVKFATSGSKYMAASPGINVVVCCTSEECVKLSVQRKEFSNPVQVFPSLSWKCLCCEEDARPVSLCFYGCSLNLHAVPSLLKDEELDFTSSDVEAKCEARRRGEPEPEDSYDRVQMDVLAGWCKANGVEQCVWTAAEPLYEKEYAEKLEEDAVEQEEVAEEVFQLHQAVEKVATESVKAKVELDVVESESEKCASAMEETIEKVSSGEVAVTNTRSLLAQSAASASPHDTSTQSARWEYAQPSCRSRDTALLLSSTSSRTISTPQAAVTFGKRITAAFRAQARLSGACCAVRICFCKRSCKRSSRILCTRNDHDHDRNNTEAVQFAQIAPCSIDKD